jgi:hypothetical protein
VEPQPPEEPDLDALLNVGLISFCALTALAVPVLSLMSYGLLYCDGAGRSVGMNLGGQLIAAVLCVIGAVRRDVVVAAIAFTVSVGAYLVASQTAGFCS